MAKEGEIISSLVGEIDRDINQFLGEWYDQALSALAVAPSPANSEAQSGWYRALAGNLLWAAVVLFPPATTSIALIRLMTFSGVAIAAGIPPTGETELNGKAIVIPLLAKARGQLETELKKNISSWAQEVSVFWNDLTVASATEDKIEVRKAFIWSKIFSGILYDQNRHEVLQQARYKAICGVLASCNRQYQAWKRAPVDCMMRRSPTDYFGTRCLRGLRSFTPELHFHWMERSEHPARLVKIQYAAKEDPLHKAR
jgi:hypothetical protein